MTPRQHSKKVESTIEEIRSHKKITSKLIKKVCEKNGVKEKSIRMIAGLNHIN